MRLFSATKWIAGVTIMAAVEEGHLTLDASPSQFVDYWTTDPADARSRVTLRALLSFTSGFGGGLTACDGLALAACGRRLYETASFSGAPGAGFEYNSVHSRPWSLDPRNCFWAPGNILYAIFETIQYTKIFLGPAGNILADPSTKIIQGWPKLRDLAQHFD